MNAERRLAQTVYVNPAAACRNPASHIQSGERMSDALNYLIAARGDALAPYFKFLKEAGRSTIELVESLP